MIHQLCVISQHFLRTKWCISHSDQVPGPTGSSCWTCGVCTLQHCPKVNVGQALFSSIIRMSAGRSFDCSDVSCWCHRMKMKHCYHTPSPAPFFQPLFQRHEGNLKVRRYHILLSFSLSYLFFLCKMSHLGFCHVCCAICYSTQGMCFTNSCKAWVTNHVRV